MAINLPKKEKCVRSDASGIVKELKSLIAYSGTAKSTYEFYEVIDNWLGPWGENGYPIGYGKKYNILFNANETLNSPDRPNSASWVRKTTVNLQLAVIQCIEQSIKNGSLATMSESYLRKCAFDSHPKAYLDAGLLIVAETEVTSLLTIASIPWREFNPLSQSFNATFLQVVHVVKDPGVLAWFMAVSKGKNKWEREAVDKLIGDASKYIEDVINDAKHELDYFFR